MDKEPHETLAWVARQSETLEGEIFKALDSYSSGHQVGVWMKANFGVGPVLAAGFLAHIDPDKMGPTVGRIWRFAGYDPTVRWEKGEKRPWNASLKVLGWKCGQSFMKFSGDDRCTYGRVYRDRKAYELARNERGGNADRAKQILTVKKFRPQTEAFKAYSKGILPPAHIDAQARRYAVKLFMSHVHLVWHFHHHGTIPPEPYGLGLDRHTHFEPPEHLDVIEGLEAAMRKANLLDRRRPRPPE